GDVPGPWWWPVVTGRDDRFRLRWLGRLRRTLGAHGVPPGSCSVALAEPPRGGTDRTLGRSHYGHVRTTNPCNCFTVTDMVDVEKQTDPETAPHYTRAGDTGTTRFGDDREIGKDDDRLGASADCTEANAAIGLVLALGGGLPVHVIT